MNFKIGDFVRVKPGIKGTENESIEYIHGRVVNIQNKTPELLLVRLDSIALQKFTLNELVQYEEDGYNMFEYNLYPLDAVLSDPREPMDITYAEHRKLVDAMFEIILQKAKDENTYIEKLKDKYYRKYRLSHYIEKFEKERRAANIVIIHIGFMWDHHKELPVNWTVEAMENICLHVIPSSYIADKKFFKMYCPVLISFLNIIEEETGNSQNRLKEFLNNISDELIFRANDEKIGTRENI